MISLVRDIIREPPTVPGRKERQHPMQTENKPAGRTAYFDYLRVFATLSVIFLHAAAQNWYGIDVKGSLWQTFNFYDSISRWGVPVFVMISGALFLSRDIPIKLIYKKYIRRLLIAFAFWSFFYMLFDKADLHTRIIIFVKGHYHMWYILMIIGLYICLPLIRPIAENRNRTLYYLALVFVFAFAIPQFEKLMTDFGRIWMARGAAAFSHDASNMNMHMVLGYAGYFVLGNYLNKISLKKWQRMVIYVLGFLGFYLTVKLTLIASLKAEKALENYYGHFTITVLLESLSVFTLFKYTKFRENKLITALSNYSFGAYLVHVFFIDLLNQFGLNTRTFNPVLSVPCITLIAAVLSYIVSAILNHIPGLKKNIV